MSHLWVYIYPYLIGEAIFMNENKLSKKTRRVYFIDYENVAKAGLKGIEELSKRDTVYIFYSAYSNSLTFHEHESLMNAKAEIVYFEVRTVGKNALDFQLSSFIGYIIGQNEDIICYIISKDNGFANVVNFWRTRGARLQLVPNISLTPKMKPVKRTEVAELLAEADPPFEEEEILFIRDTMRKHMKDLTSTIPTVKNNINSELCKKFGGQRTKIIYNALKPLIK